MENGDCKRKERKEWTELKISFVIIVGSSRKTSVQKKKSN